MRFLLVTAGLAVFGLSPALAQAPLVAPDQSSSPPAVSGRNAPGDSTTPDGLPPAAGEVPGAGTIFLVPRSMGMPPGAVMVVPRSSEAGQGASGPNEAGRRLGPPHTDGGHAYGGAMLRFRRGNDAAEIRCGSDESTQSCFQIAGPLLQRFFAGLISTPSEGGTTQTSPRDDPAPGSGK